MGAVLARVVHFATVSYAMLGWMSSRELRAVAEWLKGGYERRGRAARGTWEGVPTEVRFTLRGTGYERTVHERRWTEVDVRVPRGYALSLYVRRHEALDPHEIRRDAMVDVELGDAEFDRQFLVEAAPAQIVRMVLDAPVRRWLTDHDGATLTTEQLGGLPILRLSAPTWLAPGAIMAAIDALAGISAAVRDAYAALETAALRGVGSPYRPQFDNAQFDAQHSALADEVAFVAGLRARRSS